MALTRRQKQVLDLIVKLVDENGYSPSYEELARGLDLASLATVHKHISALDAQDLSEARHQPEPFPRVGPKFRRSQRRSRRPPWRSRLLGRIAAGFAGGIGGAERTAEFRRFRRSWRHVRSRSARRSMIDDHICDGDLILLERVDGGARRRDRGGPGRRQRDHSQAILPGACEQVRLQPANPALKPIVARATDVEIQGRLLSGSE